MAALLRSSGRLRPPGCGASRSEALARLIHQGKRVSFWWTMGVNQGHEATRTAQAIINLALITGNIGRPGTGANSITGQCNAMGSRLFSNTTNLLGGHDFTNPDHRAQVAAVLGIDEGRIPQQASLAYDQIFEKILAGQIQGLWIVATNPAHSWINQLYARDVLGRLDFLVVQDMYANTETAAAGAPGAAGGGVGGEGGDLHQFRAAHRPDQEGGARAGRGAGRLPDLPAGGRGLGLRRDVPRLDQPRGGLPDHEGAVARPALRHHRHRRLPGAGRRRRDPVAAAGAEAGGEWRPEHSTTSAACSRTVGSSTPTGGRA